MSSQNAFLSLLFAIFLLTVLACSTTRPGTKSTSYWADYYREHLHTDAKLISAGPNKTVELYQGRYLVQEYYYNTKLVTGEKTYADAALTKLEGLLHSRTDWGSKIVDSHYENGLLAGEALKYDMTGGWLKERSNYMQGKKEGLSTLYDSVGQVTATAHYRLDSLDGESIGYRENGAVDWQRVYKNGKMVSGTPLTTNPSSVQLKPQYPCNPKFQEEKNCMETSLLNYLLQTVRYPPDARDLGIQGTAIVTFVVDTAGAVTKVKVIKGYCNSIRDECVRVVSGMPQWVPASVDGKPVKVFFTLPIKFKLE